MCVSIVFLIFIFIGVSNSQIHQFGECQEIETVKYFDIEKFEGKWYEIARYRTSYEEQSTCAYKTIEVCGRRIDIQHGFIRSGIHFILHENSSFAPGDEPVFIIQPSNIDPIGVPFVVAATDYENYAIVTGCKYNEELDVRYVNGWILSKYSEMAEDVYEEVITIFNTIPNLNTVYLETVEQNKEYCSYTWTATVQAVVIDDEDISDNSL